MLGEVRERYKVFRTEEVDVLGWWSGRGYRVWVDFRKVIFFLVLRGLKELGSRR